MSYYLRDILEQVTDDVRMSLGLNNVMYMYAPIGEILDTLATASSDATLSAQRYPFVAIVTDVSEEKGQRTDMQSRVVLPSVVFATLTSQEYTTKERYEQSFKTVLQPLYEMWIQKLTRNMYINVNDPDLTAHTKTDRLSWGKSQLWLNRGVSVDNIDAIEVNGLSFMIRKQVCKPLK